MAMIMMIYTIQNRILTLLRLTINKVLKELIINIIRKTIQINKQTLNKRYPLESVKTEKLLSIMLNK
jgi:hypothetical protein